MSAGVEAGELNPLAIEVMREVGIEISNAKTKTIGEVLHDGSLLPHLLREPLGHLGKAFVVGMHGDGVE